MSQYLTLPDCLVDQSWRPAASRDESVDLVDYLIGAVISVAVTVVALIISPGMMHWCVLPLLPCGTIIGSDAVRWFRGRYDTFDIKGLIGLYGFHFFYLSPVIYIAGNVEMAYARNPDDWRPWIGGMAFANVIALLAYKLVQRWAQRGEKPRRTIWACVPGRTGPILAVGVVLSAVAFLYLLVRMGGLSGLALARTERDSTEMHRMGLPRMMSIALPMLAFFTLTIFFRGRPWRHRSLGISLIVLGILGMLQLVITGYSTSRGDMVTAAFWILVSIHYLWRPIGRVTIAWMLIPLLAFMWVYAFYKALGLSVFDYVQRGATVEELAARSQRSFASVLLGDMARVDIQAHILWVQTAEPGSYRKRYGMTYVTAPFPAIPLWLWPGKPAHAEKVVAGTELLYGRDFYDPGRRLFSSHAYGLAGEAMLNFGVWSVPFAYAFWGFLVGRFRRYARGIPPGDLRLLMLPVLIHFLINMLPWDSDNYIAFHLIRCGFALAVLLLAVGRVPCPSAAEWFPGQVEQGLPTTR